jgi:hypothetical protein
LKYGANILHLKSIFFDFFIKASYLAPLIN